MDVESLAAFDVHVHLQSTDDRTATDTAVKQYFGDSGASREASALADSYSLRKIAFVIFAVDERLTGRPHVSNEEVVRFAERNSNVAIPFASVDPNRGAKGVQEAKRFRILLN
jgi:predicted TIM-barrel fold metal-dependent hydrolase